MIILSVLIPTIPERVEMFTRLYNELHRQLEFMQTFHPSLGSIEIEVDATKRFLDGGPSIGKKREALVKKASGKYLCFLDDDESIAPNYLETLVRLCNEDKDICTFRNITKMDNYWCVIDMSLSNEENLPAGPSSIVLRRPWHICPVISYFAKMYDFEDVNYGEDFMWMEKVLVHCVTEAKTDAVIHQYNHSSKVSEADKIINVCSVNLKKKNLY